MEYFLFRNMLSELGIALWNCMISKLEKFDSKHVLAFSNIQKIWKVFSVIISSQDWLIQNSLFTLSSQV